MTTPVPPDGPAPAGWPQPHGSVEGRPEASGDADLPDASGEPAVFAVPYTGNPAARAGSMTVGLAAFSAVIATLVGVGFAVLTWWVALADESSTGLLMIAAVVTAVMAIMVWLAWRPVRQAALRRRLLADAPDAMQISADGVGFPDLDRGGWIVVPWSAVLGAKVLTWRATPFLHLEVDPALRGDEPGAHGLDRPSARRALTRRTMGLVGPRFALDGLGRPLEHIDDALRRYSGGRVELS